MATKTKKIAKTDSHQKNPEVTIAMAKQMFAGELSKPRLAFGATQLTNWLQAIADREAFSKLKDAYGADEKPLAHNQRRTDHVVKLYHSLKHRIINRTLDELGYQGRRLMIVDFYAYEEAIMPPEVKAVQNAEKPDTRKHDYVETPHGEFRKDSVLHIIYHALSKKGGATKAEIAEALEAKHPTGKGETTWSEKSTINCQIDRMPDERGFKLARTAKGKYGIEPGKAVDGPKKGEAMEFSGLTGWDKSRVQTPEQAAKAVAKAEAKAAKEAEKAKEKEAKEAAKAKAKEAEDKAKAAAKEKQAKEDAKRDADTQAAKAKADKLKG